MKDRYYKRILEGLEASRERLDPHTFEKCAVDLLRDAYPGLVPVRGGRDHGMDGAIADGEGTAYPVVVTTARNVIGNLTRSLDSYRWAGGRDRVVVATSQALTPTKRRNLERRAEEKGFVLVQVHDRSDLADRLYRHGRWVEELLGIPSEPPALSAVPDSRRPLREALSLIGRDADLEWLRETPGDRLVVGEPGSGKTHLLVQLVREGRALFLPRPSPDRGQVADACRGLDPEIILVDDAHLEPERLDLLRRLRRECGARFEIVASCWPGFEREVADALALGGSERSTRTLEGLTRRQILDLLRELGIRAPDDDPSLRMLVDQAANKPGLAVTLGSLWLRGEWGELLTGGAIRDTLLSSLTRVLEHDPTALLACFALGGDAGMSLEVVGEYLGQGRSEMHQRTSLAGGGGVLRTLGDDRLAVEPELLRPALLQAFFFDGPAFPFRDLLRQAPRLESAVETLVLAAQRGADVPAKDLEELVRTHGSRRAWETLATKDASWGRWVLAEYPGRLQEVVRGTLVRAPRPALERLLREAPEARGALHSTPSHPLRILSDWVREIPFAPGRVDAIDVDDPLRRRDLVVAKALELLEEGGDRTVALRACFLALEPLLESRRGTVRGGEIRLRWGALPSSAIPGILELWQRVFPHLDAVTKEVWSALRSALWGWMHPRSSGVEIDPQQVLEMRDVAEQMLSDLQPLADGSPGFAWELGRLARRMEISLDLSLDETYGILFDPKGPRELEDIENELAREREEADTLAREWARRDPEEVARQIASYQEEARTFGHTDVAGKDFFCRSLAAAVASPQRWLEAFLGARLDAGWVVHLLERIAEGRQPGWLESLRELVDSEEYGWAASRVVIRTREVPHRLLREVLDTVDADLVESAATGGEVPAETLRALLEQGRERVALAAAVGEWLAETRERVRTELEPAWREAVLRAGSGGGIDRRPNSGLTFWLGGILRSDPELAMAWLERRLDDVEEYETASESGVYAAAVHALTEPQRARVLERLRPDSQLTLELVPWVVGDSEALYGKLLGLDHLETHRLEPLRRQVLTPSWVPLARVAVGHGIEPEQVAGAACWHPPPWGFGVDYWRERREFFESLRAEEDRRLRDVAEHGLKIVGGRLEDAERERRRFELTGKL